MKKSTTPVCDLIDRLLSHGMSRQEALAEGRAVEGELTTAGVAAGVKREMGRIRKQKQRIAKGDVVHQNVTRARGVDSSSLDKIQKQDSGKKESTRPPRDISGDDWPPDYETQFWANFPKYRRGDRPQVFALLAKLRREKVVTWAILFAGVLRYAATSPGEYAKAPLPWLRGYRWEIDNGGGPNGKGPDGAGSSNRQNDGGRVDPVAAAAARRFGGGARHDSASAAAGANPLPSRVDDVGLGAQRGGNDAFDFGEPGSR